MLDLQHTVRACRLQVLGGTYLANFVETHNQSAPAAKLRHEWFITYASRDRVVLPAATPCAGQLTQQQLANYTQVGCFGSRMRYASSRNVPRWC